MASVQSLVYNDRMTFGLRQNDYQRYRQYCARRLNRLRQLLSETHAKGNGKYQARELPETVEDVRYLHLLIYQSERAWAYGMELKEDAKTNDRKRHHMMKRLRRAQQAATQLVDLCEKSRDIVDDVFALDIKAYALQIQGYYFFESSNWRAALDHFVASRIIYDALCRSASVRDQMMYQYAMETIDPNISVASRRLGYTVERNMNDTAKTLRKRGVGDAVDLASIERQFQNLAQPHVEASKPIPNFQLMPSKPIFYDLAFNAIEDVFMLAVAAFRESAVKAVDTCLLRAQGRAPGMAMEADVREVIAPVYAMSEEHVSVTLTDWRRTLLEDVFREYAFGLVQDQGSDKYFAQLSDFLDLCLTCERQDMMDPTVPLTLIEELLDAHTIAACIRIFDYIEDRREGITKDMVPNRGKGLVLLRLCNELLRRSSKTENTVFCGRILMFLANSFPLGERSGVNVKGEFNLENITLYEVDENMDSDKSADKVKDSTFYKQFWRLQRYFANPLALFKEQTTGELKEGIEATLAAFSALSEKEQTMRSMRAEKQDKQEGATNGKKRRYSELVDRAPVLPFNDVLGSKQHHFFPKFLTGRNLLPLEISDPYFRRNILVQILIVFQYLLGFSQSSQKEAHVLLNNSLKTPYTLSDDDANWITSLRQDVIKELRATSTDGDKFTDTILLILEHERHWIDWKGQLCKPFDISRVSMEQVEKLLSREPQLRPLLNKFRFDVGTMELTRLWKTAGLTLGKESPPTLDEYIEHLKNQMQDDLPPDEKQDLETAQAWRGLRLAAHDHFALFNEIFRKDRQDQPPLEALQDVIAHHKKRQRQDKGEEKQPRERHTHEEEVDKEARMGKGMANDTKEDTKEENKMERDGAESQGVKQEDEIGRDDVAEAKEKTDEDVADQEEMNENVAKDKMDEDATEPVSS
ncbi:hypothetical protein BZG36_02384 [Bifiguratus adelaidae]|uniref:Uncharacterized protein n=1 Tax=Bifiguratus adelaidae TaxID=1938954 RepID=A0A261Y139_9FUNG|nr:hypothetical protein BZG36_02384 [Bifiguratus adelaidae]